MTMPASDENPEQRPAPARVRSQNNRQLAQSLSASLLASEERYRTLINSIDVGFCIIEVLYDADDSHTTIAFWKRILPLSGIQVW